MEVGIEAFALLHHRDTEESSSLSFYDLGVSVPLW